MTPTVVLPVVIGGLYAAGVYLLLDRSLTRVLLGFLLLGNATNVLLLSTGGLAALAPILGFAEPEQMSDPLPQALILTAIHISIAASWHVSWAIAGGTLSRALSGGRARQVLEATTGVALLALAVKIAAG